MAFLILLPHLWCEFFKALAGDMFSGWEWA